MQIILGIVIGSSALAEQVTHNHEFVGSNQGTPGTKINKNRVKSI
jgi:hypothetical protein